MMTYEQRVLELKKLKGELKKELESIGIKIDNNKKYVNIFFDKEIEKRDKNVRKKISAYNSLVTFLPDDEKSLKQSEIFKFIKWSDDFYRNFSFLLKKDEKELSDKLIKREEPIIFSRRGEQIEKNKIKKIVPKKNKKAFLDRVVRWFKVRFGKKRRSFKIIGNRNPGSEVVVNQSVMDFSSYVSILNKKFNYDDYKVCYQRYLEVKRIGLYERIDDNIRRKFELIKEKVERIETFVKNVESLNQNEYDQQLYDKYVNEYNLLMREYGNDSYGLISNDIINILNNYKKKFEVINKKVNNDNSIMIKIEKLINKIYYFNLLPNEESMNNCEVLLNKSFDIIVELSKNEEEIINDKLLAKRYKELLLCYGDLRSEFNVNKFVMLIKNNFDLYTEKVEEIKYDCNKLALVIKLYNNMTLEEKRLTPKDILRVYEDLLHYDSVFALKSILEVLDVDKCIEDNNYEMIYYCCKIYDMFNSKLREGKCKGGNDMAKRRKEGMLAIDKFPLEIKSKLKKMLEFRESLIKENGIFNVSYFDAKVNRRNKIFAFSEVIVDGNEVETFSIPLTSDNQKEEVCSKIIKKYSFVDINRINFNKDSYVYKKTLLK